MLEISQWLLAENQRQQSTATTTQTYQQCIVNNNLTLSVDEIKLFTDTLSSYLQSVANQSLQVSDEEITIPVGVEKNIDEIFYSLNFTNNDPKILAKEVIKKLIKNGVDDFKISKTGEGEFLIYTRNEDTFRNIIIDSEGDIELLFLPKDRKKAKNKIFFREDGLYLSRIITAFNGMQ